MRLTDRQLLDALARMPFADTLELAVILGEANSTVHRALTGLLADGIAGRVNHGTVHLPTSGRWFLTSEGIEEAADVLGYATPSEFVRAYPVSQQWHTLLLRRMDAVASVYRLAMALSPGYRSRRTQVEFHRRGRFDATITLDDGRSFGIVRQGLGLRRRSLYERLRALAEWDPSHRPGTILVLVQSAWEQRLTARLSERVHLDDCTSPWSRGMRWRARPTASGSGGRGGTRPGTARSMTCARSTAAAGSRGRRCAAGNAPRCPIRIGWRARCRRSASAHRRSASSTC